MSASLDITHAPGRVTVTLTVGPKHGHITVTPERAKRIAAQLVAAAVQAEASTAAPGKRQSFADMIMDVLGDFTKKQGDGDDD